MLQNCHIVMQSKPRDWYTIKDRGWIPSGAKAEPQHEPRNGLIMCANHHLSFDAYEFFIRYCPDVQKFVFINHADAYELRPFHGKAIALDIKDRYAPFPSLFIIHEMRVRGHNPFAPAVHELPDDIPWQDWILSMDLLIDTTNSFKRNKPPPTQSPPNPYSNNSGFRPTTMNAGSASSNQRLVAMNADVINDILAATFAMPSWRACQIEGTSWTGTGEENIKKYISSIGVEDESDS
ncbi:hypothetical protein M413DRAFT_442161 [Hebeloma cylindrosporum]|uniref:HNH nuclease domain-containing protein n=1 Tax=Hebeloma cylindrosporum TaxID=76867 RepID=A0A0C2YWW6_HEBCY|nr:hypothetical protein M413DRAFT_442161 [Hebeloma cylindrosporum h7]